MNTIPNPFLTKSINSAQAEKSIKRTFPIYTDKKHISLRTTSKSHQMPPEESSRLKEFMRIKDDYFLEIPDDLKPEQIETAIRELKSLCQSVSEKDDTF